RLPFVVRASARLCGYRVGEAQPDRLKPATKSEPAYPWGSAGSLFVAGFSLSGCASDRKSTRLNSSHVEISYAVFCLKKKTLTSQLPSVGSGGLVLLDDHENSLAALKKAQGTTGAVYELADVRDGSTMWRIIQALRPD